MKDTALYEQLLGLSDPWSVKQVELSLEDNRVTVEVELKRGIIWVDPEVEGARAHIHGWTERQWRHLDTCQFETIIKARVPQLKYRSGKVEELAVPWAERYARVTVLMEAFVLRVLAACSSTQKVSELMKLNWHTINEIMRRGVERGLLRREEQPMPHLGIDEKSIAKGHSYASILTDIDGSRVLDLVEGRQLAASEALLGTLSESQRTGVEAIAMDMWPAFMTAARNCLPQADVVHDRFHVSKYLNESVDAVRRAEQRQLLGAGDSPLTGSKWAWLKSYPDGRSAEALAFRSLHQMNLKTSRAWRIKESFTGFWSYRYTASAQHYFEAWAASAMRSRLEPVKKVVRMLRRHLQGLLNYARHHISNAAAEGFNSSIQTIKANARGFRSFQNYRIRILFHCGKLNMLPAI